MRKYMENTLINMLYSFLCGESAKELAEYNALADSLQHIFYGLDCISLNANYVSGVGKVVLSFACLLFLLFFVWLFGFIPKKKEYSDKIKVRCSSCSCVRRC